MNINYLFIINLYIDFINKLAFNIGFNISFDINFITDLLINIDFNS